MVRDIDGGKDQTNINCLSHVAASRSWLRMLPCHSLSRAPFLLACTLYKGKISELETVLSTHVALHSYRSCELVSNVAHPDTRDSTVFVVVRRKTDYQPLGH